MTAFRSPATIKQGGGGTGSGGFTDAFGLEIDLADSNAAPTDVDSYLLNLAQADAIDVQAETVSLAFPAPDFADSSTTPTDTNTFTLRAWCSGTTATGNGATNPNNVNGQQDGAVGTLQSAAAGATVNFFDSNLGVNLPAGITITSAVLTLWFKSVNTLVTTSSGSITSLNITPQQVFFANSALNTTVDHLTAPLTVDLLALGLSVASVRALGLEWKATDPVAGVTPHVMTVDAASIDIAGAFT